MGTILNFNMQYYMNKEVDVYVQHDNAVIKNTEWLKKKGALHWPFKCQ